MMKKTILILLIIQSFWLQQRAFTQINILVNNQDDKTEWIKQARFYLQYFAIDTVNLFISFTTDLPSNYNGYTIQQSTNSKNLLIKIRKNLNRISQMLVLAHELVHVKQFLKKELISQSCGNYLWKGRLIKNIKQTNYLERDWEKEAIRLEYWLLSLYEKYNKEKKQMLIAEAVYLW